MIRIGHGFDAHRFIAGDHVMLAGVRIAYERGVEAHSDGDVLIHALCDAMLGAAGLGDIGAVFPDSDPQWRDLPGMDMLERVRKLIAKQGYVLLNADLTLIAQAPRVAEHRQKMRDNLAGALKIHSGSVNVKATTTEGMGAIGRGEGLAAQAVVLLQAN